ncbi:uncharacterized protein BP01DRAFT_384863 [Aspergillus saccharolyticus JOP 1030-1]|uniref:FAD/NAD(P)-binding domain-containing protein n=1 Tax=Aspergillus saccharolyticus JOP 1030-1 TaxID=1450539 RepID=A0A318Z9R5_9EURO|nr:hypothetical protein BP01DRAFT_384863 [Aspergillus saccharolyticus JOP 1030-1]PYH43167.1 hypothetical protein BP01DRAFT_384863 [Aspergillus saccharolyticus JOP 1030-1]
MTHPITEGVAEGIRTADGRLNELDVIVVATGFDAMDGSYARRTGSERYLGCSVSGYLNLLIVSGPMFGFANVPPLTESNVEFLRDLPEGGETLKGDWEAV